MIRIGICDDEPTFRGQIKEICSAYLNTQVRQQAEFVEFKSGKEVLDYQGEKIHLLFLDIEMPGADGLEVLSKVRKNERIWRIVFVTSHKELKWETVDLKTLAFLEKPLDKIGIETCLKTVIREEKENIEITYKTLDGDGYIPLDRIVLIQAKGNYISIYTETGEFSGFSSTKEIEEQIEGTTMIRTHKSYLVNLQHVGKMNGANLQMTNGVVVPVGRKYLYPVKEAYFAFIKRVTIDRNR
jgi:DNA-binding LytR/AlgR family response regulator